MPKINSKCIFCQKKFDYYPSEKNGKYCSQSCRIQHKKQIAGMDKERICSFCSKIFDPKYSYQKTCSKECGINSSAKIREKIYDFECKNCGIKDQSHRKDRTTYCSLNCYYELLILKDIIKYEKELGIEFDKKELE